MPRGMKRGVCRVCGEPADSKEATYCAEHRPLTSDRPPTPGKVKPAGSSTRRAGDLELSLRTQLEMAASLWAISDPTCGAALFNQAGEMAAFWADRARSSARIAAVLEGVTSTGGWLGGVVVHAPLLIAVYSHHVLPVLEARRAEREQLEGQGDAGAAQPGPWPPDVAADGGVTHGAYPTADPNDPAAQAAWAPPVYPAPDGDASL